MRGRPPLSAASVPATSDIVAALTEVPRVTPATVANFLTTATGFRQPRPCARNGNQSIVCELDPVDGDDAWFWWQLGRVDHGGPHPALFPGVPVETAAFEPAPLVWLC